MKLNDIIEIEITGVTSEGNGVGRYDNIAVFVTGTAPGDRIKVKITKVGKNFCVGEIVKILSPAKTRRDPDCESYSQCGGCVYRHIDYKEELRLKREMVADAMRRIGKVTTPVGEILHGKSEGYRNKAQYPIAANGKTGFFAVRSHKIIPCDCCRLQPEEFSIIAKLTEVFIKQYNISVYNEQTGKGLMRHLYIRTSSNGDIMVVPVINGASLPHADMFVSALLGVFGERIKSVIVNINRQKTNVILGEECKTVYGNGFIEDTLCGIRLRISPLSFYQVNHDMAEILYKKAAEYAAPEGKTVIDLYCGTGAIGLTIAKSAKSVIGVEIVPEAIEDAKVNAKLNGIENTRFICADAARAAETLRQENTRADVVIVDPPRKGCDASLLSIIANDFCPETLVYVSCDPATLARDCKILEELGYRVTDITPVDLFPRTSHCECVCALKRQKK